jgi:hypothetical protein
MREPKVELSWEAPPRPYSSSKYRPIIDEVKGRPGSWAKVGEWSHGRKGASVHNIRARLIELADDPHFEAKVIRIDEETTGLWVRWRNEDQMKANGD